MLKMIPIPAITPSPNTISILLIFTLLITGFIKAVNNAIDEKQLIAIETFEALMAPYKCDPM